MTKILIDRALIEQAIEALPDVFGMAHFPLRQKLRAALVEPAVEPFGYFRAEPFGWADCAPTDEGAKALYEVPPPVDPAGEPVAEVTWDGVNPNTLFIRFLPAGIELSVGTKLYTSPQPPAEPAVEPVATVRSWTNGSYWRNYKLEWHKDVPEGTKLYASPPPPAEVPLLTEIDIAQMWGKESFDTFSAESCYVRGVLRGEAAVRRNAGLK